MTTASVNKTITGEGMRFAFLQSFVKLNPRILIKNPVMFMVAIGTLVMILVTLISLFQTSDSLGTPGYNLVITLILFVTVLFGNFAEAIAEAKGKAQADSLRKTRQDTEAKKILANGEIKSVSSAELRKGDVFLVEAGEIIPADGEIIEGLASVDESAITGESAPVIREAETDHNSVIGGTKVLSDQIKVKVVAEPGESFLDKMIKLVEGANRQKTPNEIALTILLASFTLVFLIVTVTLKPFGDLVNAPITIAALVSLFVCLIPTTIGGLLSAIGIAGMDRALKANLIAKSGKAVETAGDIDVLLLDKTGTITIGNRKATNFYPLREEDREKLNRHAAISSFGDPTPEGKSILELAKSLGANFSDRELDGSLIIKFSAETRISGIDLADGTKIRKGSWDSICFWSTNTEELNYLEETVKKIAANGGTPLAVAVEKKAIGVIQLEDIIKHRGTRP